jgi:hypothetical protein
MSKGRFYDTVVCRDMALRADEKTLHWGDPAVACLPLQTIRPLRRVTDTGCGSSVFAFSLLDLWGNYVGFWLFTENDTKNNARIITRFHSIQTHVDYKSLGFSASNYPNCDIEDCLEGRKDIGGAKRSRIQDSVRWSTTSAPAPTALLFRVVS